MAIEKVREFFKQYNCEDKILEFDVSSATVQLAAQALGCPPERIAKSLTFKTDNAVIMVVAAGDARVDNKKYKECFGTKAKMLSAEEVEELVGYAVGGVVPSP